MPDEILDIVNDDDLVTGQALRSVVHEQGLQHRGVHVFLLTKDGKILIQQRSKDRLQSPLALDCSVSEHVKAGEDYEEAALRGLMEELGITGIKILPLLKFKMNYGPNDNEISILFQGFIDSTVVHFDPIEIERIDYYSLNELQKLMKDGKIILSYWFKQILQWYLGNSSDLNVIEIYSDVHHFVPKK